MMKRDKNCSKLLLGFAVCMLFVFTAGFHNRETRVGASGVSDKYADASVYGQKFMEQCCPGIEPIGEVYITGGIMEPKYTQRVPVYSVAKDTEIQGRKIQSKYLPQGNIQNLKEIYASITGFREFEWINGEYQASGGEKEYVVAYDKYNIIFWSNGYKAFGASPAMCHQSDIMMSHPPGFYSIPRGKAWMKLYKYNERNKYDAKKDKDGNIIVEYRGKGRATSHYIGISSLAEYLDTGNVYYEKCNTEFLIADTRRISTKKGTVSEDELYYKVIYRAKNDVYYLSDFEYFYVPAKYINLYRNGVKVPANLTDGKIVDPDYSASSYYRDIPVYKDATTSAKIIGYVQKDALVQYYEKDSNKTWSKVYYNSDTAYIKTRYIQKVVKPVVAKPKPAPKKVSVKTIKNNEYVMTWSKASGCKDYKIILTKNPTSLTKKNIVYQNNHYKGTTYTVKNSVLKKNTKTGLYLCVAANYSHGTSVNTRSDLIYMGTKPPALKKSQLKISKKEIKIVKYKREVMRLQYATNKSFKKAKTITAKDGMITSIKKLKSKKTYYIRYADRDYTDTDSGGKLVYTDWSNTLKVKTK